MQKERDSLLVEEAKKGKRVSLERDGIGTPVAGNRDGTRGKTGGDKNGLPNYTSRQIQTN